MPNIGQLIGLLQGFGVPDVDCGLIGGRNDSFVIWRENQTGDEVSMIFQSRRNNFVFFVRVKAHDSIASPNRDEFIAMGSLDTGDLVTNFVLKGYSGISKVNFEEGSPLKMG